MSEYLIQEETLQGIADKIRVLSGTEGTMTPAEMQSDLDTFNTDMGTVVSEQDDLIAQITAALENKVTPSISVSDDGNGNVTIVTNGANISV